MKSRVTRLAQFFVLASAVIATTAFENIALAVDQPTVGLGADNVYRDAEGRIAYMVNLKSGAATSYTKSFLSSARYPAYHKGEVVNLVHAMEWQYHFEASSMTSWVGASFAAYLTPDQYAHLQKDYRVLSISPDEPMVMSGDTTAVWSDSVTTLAAPPNSLWSARVTQATQMLPWGKRAVNQSLASSSGNTLVYVVDAGVGRHQDLNVVEWVNPMDHAYDCGTRTGVGLSPCTNAQWDKLVACFTHSTAVAGVIGAIANSSGIVGVDPGASIVSVAVENPNEYQYPSNATCVRPPTSPGHSVQASRVHAALDWVKSDIAVNNHTGRPSVVNMSMNWVDAAEWPTQPTNTITTIKQDMQALASGSPGAFVVQSAGNQFESACAYAYSGTLPNDGIFVVGAINNHGQPVVPLNGAPGFWRDIKDTIGGFAHEPGSNYGSCVEGWAPGDAVFTTMGLANEQSGDIVYNTYAYGSGTSFSAPHVAGLAAYMIETRGLTSPTSVESNIRGAFSILGSKDKAGLAINLPTVSPLPAGAVKNTPYAEFVLSTACIYPKHWDGTATGTLPPGCQVLSTTNPQFDPSLMSGAMRNGGQLSLANNLNVWLAFDSYGTAPYSCDVKRLSSTGSSQLLATVPGTQNYYNPSSGIGATDFATSTICTSAQTAVVH
jgi:hypothetical protein